MRKICDYFLCINASKLDKVSYHYTFCFNLYLVLRSKLIYITSMFDSCFLCQVFWKSADADSIDWIWFWFELAASFSIFRDNRTSEYTFEHVSPVLKLFIFWLSAALTQPRFFQVFEGFQNEIGRDAYKCVWRYVVVINYILSVFDKTV